jgi:hypothetical protein
MERGRRGGAAAAAPPPPPPPPPWYSPEGCPQELFARYELTCAVTRLEKVVSRV